MIVIARGTSHTRLVHLPNTLSLKPHSEPDLQIYLHASRDLFKKILCSSA